MNAARRINASRWSPRRQAGVTLVEALVAMLIMAFGMLALVGLQGNMRRSADFAKQRSEAVRLAQQELEKLRAFSILERDNSTPAQTLSYDQLVDTSRDDAGDTVRNTVYTLTRDVSEVSNGASRLIQVTISWVDRAGATQQLSLSSLLARADPKLGAALAIAPEGSPTRRPKDRSVVIPTDAKDLGDGRSVFKPPASGGVAWVFDNLSGKITSLCSGLSADLQSSAISSADVAANCNNTITAYLLSGTVRFSTGSTPDPITPVSPALPLDMGLDILHPERHPSPAYQCFDDAPASATNTQTGGVRYFCAVYPDSGTPPAWSGTLRVSGIDVSNSGYKICRYSADYNSSGSIDNEEHPQQYSSVSSSLVGQNFLVVLATSSCPVGHAYDPDNGYFFNSATVQHQP